MPNFKVVFVYSNAPEKGFSEVYYRTASQLQSAAMFDQATLTAALRFRSQLTILRKIRVSDVDQPRSSIIRPINQNGWSVPSSVPETTGVAAVTILASSQFGSSRRVWFRGLNAVDVQRDPASGADVISSGMKQTINRWISILGNNAFTIRSLVPISVPPNIYQRITAISGTVGAGETTIAYQGQNPPTVGKRVIISQLNPKLYPALNGHYTVLSVALGTFTVAYNLDTAPQVSEKTGRWRPETYQYGNIDPSISGFDHFGTRTTGAGFTAGRGRKRAVRLRSL